MKLKVDAPIVDVDWLYRNLDNEHLLILDATIPKVGQEQTGNAERKYIKSAHFFDIKNVFSDLDSVYPNTIPSTEKFQQEAQNIGVNKTSCIVVYDALGVYSSPRVWWLFRTFGLDNIAVLDGGLPEWLNAGYPIETESERKHNNSAKGDFQASYQTNHIRFTEQVLDAIQKEICIVDARSENRFYGRTPEPRAEVRSGHIPSAISLPYTSLLNKHKWKSKEELLEIFTDKNKEHFPMIFSCGSGITACILALGATIAGLNNYAVYDGSWTEWGSRQELPLETE